MTIVVGVDGSGPSRAALGWAVHRAVELGSAVELVHVVDDEWGQAGQGVARIETEESGRMLNAALDLAAGLAPGLTLSSQLLHGSPAWELSAAANDAELLVVGTHKTGYLHGRVLGTRSVVIASIATCSVAVIPDGPATRRRGVIVGVAPGAAWRDAVILGAREAERLGDALSLIHASAGGADAVTAERDDGRALLAAASAVATETAPGTVVRSRLSRRRPSEALLDASRAEGLLVLGQSRRDTANAGFLGSVTHEVLLNINSPVIIARGLSGL